MTSQPVSVVVVSWNSAPVLPACLEALAAAGPAELVVVDNASTDASREAVSRFGEKVSFPVTRIDNDCNRGFAAAANQGLAVARHPYVLFLNPDVRLSPGFLATLRGSLELAPQDVVVAGGKLLRAEGDDLQPTTTIDSTGIVVTFAGRHFDRGAGEVDQEQWDGLGEVFGITGAALLARRQALLSAAVDGEVFDEDFFAYREDADLAWRLRGFGLRALYDPDAVAWHQRRVTPERRRQLPAAINARSVTNRFLLRIHHADLSWWLAGGWRSLGRDFLVIGACLSVEWRSLPALVRVVRLLPRHLRRRREILRRRRVAASGLAEWFSRN